MLPRALIVLFLCLSLLSCKSLVDKYKRSSSGTSAVDKKVLFDFRQPMVSQNSAAGAPLIAGCTKIAAIDGSFTYAAEQETASLMQCGDTRRIAIYSSGKLQASSDTAYSQILASFDLNQDDKNEILIGTEVAKGGVADREASLVDFEKNSLHPVEDFGTVYHDPCGLFANIDAARKQQLIAGGRSPYIEAVVVSYLPRPGNQMPSFTAERYRAPCSSPAQWQRVTIH